MQAPDGLTVGSPTYFSLHDPITPHAILVFLYPEGHDLPQNLVFNFLGLGHL